MVGFVGKTQSIVVGFVVKMQSIVVECLRLDSGLPIITADFTQSLQAPSLRQQKAAIYTRQICRQKKRLRVLKRDEPINTQTSVLTAA